MVWCFSTRASVATVLTTHPWVSRCLRVNDTSCLCCCVEILVGNINIYWHFISYLTTLLVRVVEILSCERWGQFNKHIRCCGYWWLGNARIQSISCHDIDLVIPGHHQNMLVSSSWGLVLIEQYLVVISLKWLKSKFQAKQFPALSISIWFEETWINWLVSWRCSCDFN